MDAASDLSAADRVMQLLRQLGVARAHFVMGAEVAAAHPEAVASLALVTPMGGEAPPLQQLAAARALAAPPLIIHSDSGPLAGSAPFALAAFPGATAVVLGGYASALWSDTLADRPGEIADALLAHLATAERHTPLPPLRPTEEAGEVAGITYQTRGSGPPLLLFPLYLVPSQWEPIIPALADHYCTVTLGGPHLGFVAALEHRAAGGYGAVVDGLIDALRVPEGGAALEVGCGPGMFARRLARRAGPRGRVVGLDLNAYLLREAESLARREGLVQQLTFRVGDAGALPFPDASFDAALACTVLDETDAERGLAELLRVVRPGGRVAVAVRAVDVPGWDSLPLRPELRARGGVAGGVGVTAGACADASLYRRFHALGFTDATMGPRYAVHWAGQALPAWRAFLEGLSLGGLTGAEAEEWRAAAAEAQAAGDFLWALTLHCAVGTRP